MMKVWADPEDTKTPGGYTENLEDDLPGGSAREEKIDLKQHLAKVPYRLSSAGELVG